MTKPITENDIELFAIEELKNLGYEYLYGPDIAPDSDHPQRMSYEQVLVVDKLNNAVKRINPEIPTDIQAEAIKEIQRIASPDLLANNETFHRFLTEGIPVTKRINGIDRGDRVWLIDFNHPENNEFAVINQFTIIENTHNKRPDILLFVNGIPLVVIELKNPADEAASVRAAFRQIEAYKAVIPSLFTFNGFVIISDGLEAKAGTISSGFSRFMTWRTSDGKAEASPLTNQLETLIRGMFNKETLLDLIRHFIVFEKRITETHGGASQRNITTISTVKKMAAYHQYYAVNRAVESTLRAAGYNSPPMEGWSQTGVVKRNSKNYFALPYNPELKERARALRKAGNLAEVLFWNQVKNKQFKGYDFDRQKIIGNYIVDFYCGNCQVVIEIDGSSHDNKEEYDARRDAYLESLELNVIHIPALDILKRLGVVMDMLYDHPVFQGDMDHPALKGTPPKEGNFSEDPKSYGLPGVKQQPVGDRKGGVVWHTQGSGKSLSMVFYTGKIVLELDNPTILVITDRNDLDDQLFDTFAASTQLLRQTPVQADSREQLKSLLKVASGGIVFSTIQKFQPEEGNVYELLSDRKNIVVIADEAHRTQYGLKPKTIDVKDYKGKVVGKTMVYGFAKYMRDALSNATYLGFTGTPIERALILIHLKYSAIMWTSMI